MTDRTLTIGGTLYAVPPLSVDRFTRLAQSVAGVVLLHIVKRLHGAAMSWGIVDRCSPELGRGFDEMGFHPGRFFARAAAIAVPGLDEDVWAAFGTSEHFFNLATILATCHDWDEVARGLPESERGELTFGEVAELLSAETGQPLEHFLEELPVDEFYRTLREATASFGAH
jgi:hypothetical protein